MNDGWPEPDEIAGSMTTADREHLKVLAICYYVFGGLGALGTLFLGAYAALFGVLMRHVIDDAQRRGQQAPPEGFIEIFSVVLAVLAAFALVATVLNFVTARSLQTRRRRVLCLITAGINCLQVPLGTVLGIFTFLVLGRRSVKAAFVAEEAPHASAR